MKTLKVFLVALLTVSMLCMTGCWNYRELEEIAIVTGFAVDKGKDGYPYEVTFEFLDPKEQQPKPRYLITQGKTIFEAIRNAVADSERRLYFPDAKILVISKDLAASGVAPIFDFVLRDQELRITMIPVVSTAPTAGEMLQRQGVSSTLISLDIWKAISESKENLSESPNVQLYEAANLLDGDGCALVLATIKPIQQGELETAELDGSAIFKKDKLVGYIKREDTKFFLFVRNKVQGGLLVFSPENDGQNITLEIFGSKTKITPEIQGDQVTMNINVEVQASLADDTTVKNYVTQDGIEKLEASAQKYVESGIQQLVEKTQKNFGCDIFCFGKTISQYHPDYWNKVKDKWDQEFIKAKCKVTARVKIDNTGVAKDKIKVSENG
ncbi:Ger(x)C family spore germination protein [Caproiciproducens sp. LBM24188]